MKRKIRARNTGSSVNLTGGQGQMNIGGDVVGRDEVVISQGDEVVIPSPEAVARHRAALKEKLEEENASWALYIREEGAVLPVEASPYQAGRLGR